MIGAASGLDARQPADELSIFARVRMLKDLDCLDRIDGEVQPEVSGGGIVGVDSVYQQRALLLGRAFDAQLAFCRTNHAGTARQPFVPSGRPPWQRAKCLALDIAR